MDDQVDVVESVPGDVGGPFPWNANCYWKLSPGDKIGGGVKSFPENTAGPLP